MYRSYTYFLENLQKIIEDLYLFTEKSEICILCIIYGDRDSFFEFE